MALIQKNGNADLITLAAKSNPIAFYTTDQAAQDAYDNGEIPEGTIVFTEEEADKLSDQWTAASGITKNDTYVTSNYPKCSVMINKKLGLAICEYSFQLSSYPPADTVLWSGLPKSANRIDFQSPIQSLSSNVAMCIEANSNSIKVSNLNEGSLSNKWVAGSFTYILHEDERA